MIAEKLSSLRAHPPAMRLAIFGFLLLLVTGGLWIAETRLPSDGVLLESFVPRSPTVSSAMLSTTTSIQRGDRIEAVGGLTLWEIGNRALRGEPLPDRRVGQRVYYRVQRQGQILEFPILLVDFPWRRWFPLRIALNILALVVLVEGWYFLLRYPEERTSYAIFIFGLSSGIMIFLPLQISVLWHPLLFLTIYSIKLLCYVAVGASLPLLSLVFPRESEIKPHYRPLALTGVGVIGLSIALSLLLRDSPMEQMSLLQHTIRSSSVLFFLWGEINLWRICVTERHPLVCNRIHWIMWGSGVGAFLFIALYIIPARLFNIGFLLPEAITLFLVLVMIFVTASILKYRIADVNIFMLHVTAYVFLGLSAVGVYFGIQYILNYLSRILFNMESFPRFIPMAMLFTIAVFEVIRPLVVKSVERYFYGEFYDIFSPQFLDQMWQKFAMTLRFDPLVELLGIDIPRRIGAQYGSILVLNQEETALETVLGKGAYSISVDQIWEPWVRAGGSPVMYQVPPKWFPPAAVAEMEKRGVCVTVPMVVGGHLVGLFSLGPHQHRRMYTSAELKLLQAIARQAALAVQNARLVRQMDQQRSALAQEVQQRTAIMARDRDRLNAILQNMADALLVTGADGRILLVNPAFEALVHRSARSLLGHPVEEALLLPELVEVIEQVQRHRSPINEVTVTVTAPADMAQSGSEIQLSERILRVAVTALVDGSAVISILRDVTHEVEIFRAKTDFISNISHELRTPLTSIMGFAKLAHRTLKRSLLPSLEGNRLALRSARRIERNLDIMISESERLTALINDVLDIAALDAGTIVWKEREYEWPPLIHEVLERAQKLVQDRNLTIQANLPSSLPKMIGDPERIQQVLDNLLSNAIKFTDHGMITINLTLLAGGTVVHDWTTPREGGVLVSVTDTGAGMSAEVLTNLFKRFRQGGNVMLDKPQGTGLGLAISQAILLHHGGTIWAVSKEGLGTTVSFTLPSIPSRQLSVAGDSDEPEIFYASEEGDSLPLILVADDEISVRTFLIEALLSSEKYRVLSVANGADTIEYAKRYHPDAILLDIKMPDLSGIEVLQILKSNLKTVAIPVIMISVADYQKSCMALGASAYLMKPINLTLLHRTLDALFVPKESTADSMPSEELSE